MTNTALDLWTNQDDRSLNELLGFDDNGMPIEPQYGSDTQMRVVGMNLHFPDDLSTIAGDTLGDGFPNDDENPRTPEKLGRSIKFGANNDDADTLPETPPKYSNGSLASKSYTDAGDGRRWSRCRLLLIAGILGSILLGAIAAMSLTLYQMRNDNDADSSASSNQQQLGQDSSFFDTGIFGENSPSPTASPLVTPTSTTTRPMTDSIRDTILSAMPDFYTASSAPLMDPMSIQYELLDWLAQDPSISSYSPERIVQRFALGAIYWSLAPARDSSMGGWMTYTDECQWPTSRNSRSLCLSSDTVTALYLEDMGFNGTLAPEIGMLTNLELVFLTSNKIHGELPTELGLLTILERLNLPRNEIEGTLPTEIGLLENLGVLGLGNNGLVGTVPSEFGNMERLGSLLLQNNALNGTLPDEISLLSRLSRLQLDFNNFEGPLPEGLGNLTMLEELTLQGNSFSGEIPSEVCSFAALDVATVDCEMVACACCVGCESVPDTPNDGPDDQTSPPIDVPDTEMPTPIPSTGSPTFSPTGTSTTPPTAAPTVSLSTGSPAPTACQDIQAMRDCFQEEERIDFKTFNCEPSEFDVIALYRVQDLRQSGLRNAIFWMPSSCPDTTAECSFSITEGFLFRDNDMDTADRLETTPWPFPTKEYVLFLFRVFEPGSLQITAESFPFRVAEECPMADP